MVPLPQTPPLSPQHQTCWPNNESTDFLFQVKFFILYRCGNVAAILELDEHLQRDFTIFEAAPQVRLLFVNLESWHLSINIFQMMTFK